MKGSLVGLKTFTIPAGATSGARIVFNANGLGTIDIYNAANQLAAVIAPDYIYSGDIDGQRLQIDPLSGLRVYNLDNILTTILDKDGVQLRHPTSGVLLATLTTTGLIILDSSEGQDIEITTSSASSKPEPRYLGHSQDLAGSNILPTPTTVPFTNNDLVLRHVAVFAGSPLGVQTMTQPGFHTEILDVIDSTDNNSLGVGVASKSPALATDFHDFSSTSTDFPLMTGGTILLRGTPGGLAPSIRSGNDDFILSTDNFAEITLVGPPIVAAGDSLVAFVTIGNDGGSVPVGWTTPTGWVFKGASAFTLGSGVLQRSVASGLWHKVATGTDVAGNVEYDITVTTTGGRKKFHYAVYAIKDLAILGGGADIRVGGRSVPRGGIVTEFDSVSSASVTAETVVLTSDPVICFPSRAYRVSYSARISGTAGTDGVFNIRQDDVSGTTISAGGRIRMASGGLTQGASEDGIFAVDSAGEIVIALTLQNVAAGANVVQHRAPRYLLIEDIGSSDAFPFAVLLTP